jgi:hypothetical protein
MGHNSRQTYAITGVYVAATNHLTPPNTSQDHKQRETVLIRPQGTC